MEYLSTTQRFLFAVARILALGAAVLAPWMFGGAQPWAYCSIAFLALLAVGVWLSALICYGGPRIRAPGLLAALLALAVFAWLQSVPLGSGPARVLNPMAAVLREHARHLLAGMEWPDAAGRSAGLALPEALSVSPAATHAALLLWLTYVGAFAVLANTVREWRHLRRAAQAFVISSFFLAVLAIVHKFSGAQDIFWIQPPPRGGYVFGPFTNRNHMAAHLNMALGLALGLFLSQQHFRNVFRWTDLRNRIAVFSTPGAAATILLAFTLLVLVGAVGASLSRGALLSLCGALLIAGFLVFPRREGGRRALVAFSASMGLLGATLLWFGQDQLLERIGTLGEVAATPLSQTRFVVARDAFSVFQRFPLVGSGFGTFEHVYPLRQSHPLNYRWLHAHNDWLQLLVEGGVVGAALWLLAGALFVRLVLSRFGAASRRARLLTLGILIGLTTIALHSLLDYSLHKAANAILLATLTGLAVAAVHIAPGGHTPRSAVPHRAAWLRTGACAGLVIAVLCLLDLRRELRGELAAARFDYQRRSAEKALSPESLHAEVQAAESEAAVALTAVRHAPATQAALASALLSWGSFAPLPRETRTRLVKTALIAAGQAAAGAPSDYMPWVWLGRTQLMLGRFEEAQACADRARSLVLHPDQIRLFDVASEQGSRKGRRGTGTRPPQPQRQIP